MLSDQYLSTIRQLSEPQMHLLLTTKKASNQMAAHPCCSFEDKWTACMLPISKRDFVVSEIPVDAQFPDLRLFIGDRVVDEQGGNRARNPASNR
jgi:hypothetical protein